MDEWKRDLKIIKSVKACDTLYKSNHSLQARKEAWKRLAEDLDLPERFLKLRWHVLLERYQSECDGGRFKYKSEMDFLKPHLRRAKPASTEKEEILPANVIKPEFIITEKDLENDSGNEEYVFMEVETLEGSLETESEAKEESEETRNAEEQVKVREPEPEEEQLEENQDTNTTAGNDKRAPEEENENEEQVESMPEVSQPETEPAKEISKDESRSQSDDQVTEEIISTNPAVETSKNIKTEPIERSEDVIFGELVTAMLQHMPDEKKRSVKKGIMNLLLS